MSYRQFVDQIISSVDSAHEGSVEIRDFGALFGYFGRNMEEVLGKDRSEVFGLFLNGISGECPDCDRSLKSGEIRSIGGAQASREMPMQGITVSVGDKALEPFVDGVCSECRGTMFRVHWRP